MVTQISTLSPRTNVLSRIKTEHIFMFSAVAVNVVNYSYNLFLGRILGPAAFSDAALIITFLLILSFFSTTFQLVVANFSAKLTPEQGKLVANKLFIISLIAGGLLGILCFFFSTYLSVLFRIKHSIVFVIFSICIPIYFFLSANRGLHQGNKRFTHLAITYQTEVWGKFFFTFLLINLLSIPSDIAIALSVLISLLLALIPINSFRLYEKATLDASTKKSIFVLFRITMFYEFTQILINNSDIVLVKMFFDNEQAGYYSSLALIGRVVYFMTWMFVMILMPKVIHMAKEKLNVYPLLYKYILLISVITGTIILSCYIMSTFIVNTMFGSAYASIANLLWKYAFATALFALSNLFTYFYLSLNKYIPVFLSACMGLLQVVLILLFHTTLNLVVEMQMISMVLLFIAQLIFFVLEYKKYKMNNLSTIGI